MIKAVSKLLEKVLKYLSRLLCTHGWDFAVVLLHRSTGQVVTHASPGLRGLISPGLISPEAVGAAYHLSQARSAVLAQQLQSGAVALSAEALAERNLLGSLLPRLVDSLIPDRRAVLPYNSSPNESSVLEAAPWWPPGLPYQSPHQMEAAQQAQLFAAMARNAAEDVQPLLHHYSHSCKPALSLDEWLLVQRTFQQIAQPGVRGSGCAAFAATAHAPAIKTHPRQAGGDLLFALRCLLAGGLLRHNGRQLVGLEVTASQACEAAAAACEPRAGLLAAAHLAARD